MKNEKIPQSGTFNEGIKTKKLLLNNAFWPKKEVNGESFCEVNKGKIPGVLRSKIGKKEREL